MESLGIYWYPHGQGRTGCTHPISPPCSYEQVFDPPTAQKYGYIDVAGSTYNDTLRALAKEAKIEEKYQVVELKVQFPVLSGLIDGRSPLLSGKIKHELTLPSELPKEFLNKPLYLYLPGSSMESQ